MTVAFGITPAYAEGTVPAAGTDGTPLQYGAWFDLYGRQVLYGANIAIGTLDVSEVAPWGTQRMTNVWSQLTTAAPTYTAAVDVSVYHHLTFQVVVAALGAGESVVLQFQGSHDNTSWFNLDDAGVSTTISANGNYMFHKDNFVCKYVRVGAMSEVGAGANTEDITLYAGN